MTNTDSTKPRKWRTLKQIYRHYLVNSERSDGKSAADVIKACFAQRAFEDRTFKHFGTAPHAELIYKDSVKSLEAVLEKTEADVHRLVVQEAEKGVWMALGRRSPDSTHEVIPSRYWTFLTLDIDNNAVRSNGLSFRDLRCFLAKDIAENDPIRTAVERAQNHSAPEQQASSPIAVAATERIVGPPLSPTDSQEIVRTGAPGHPTSMHLVLAEFDRRCRESEVISSTVIAEAEHLAAWLKSNHPRAPRATARTIENNIRHAHRRVKKGQSNPTK